MAWPRRSAPCGIADGLSSQSRSEQLQPRANPGWSGSQRSRQRVRPALRSIAPSRCGWWADREPEIRRDNRRRGSQNHLFWLLGFLGLCFGVWVWVSVSVSLLLWQAGVWSVCGVCVWGMCGCWCKEFLPFPSGLVWTHFPHIRFLLVMAACYTTGTCHIPRTASAGNHRGGPSAEVPTRGGGEEERVGRGVRCWAAATLTCPRTTHRTQLTAHSSQHTARVHTHTGTQGHTVGTLGGLALSSASTHSSGPPNDAHHGRSALHQRRQAASRSSPWWTPPPSG